MLSVGGVDSNTKAVITDGTDKTMNNFDIASKIFMVMKSEKDPATHGGYEYQGDRPATLYTVCRGDVAANSSVVTFDSVNQKYWDDAHARSSILSIWAYAQKGQTWTDCYFQKIVDNEKLNTDAAYEYRYQTGTITYPWDVTEVYPAIREWGAMLKGSTVQTAQTVMCQDLLFSNNLTYNSAKSWPDNRLKFNFLTKQFPQSNSMKFYHAMAKITIQIKAGDGFKADGTDFKLKNNTVDVIRGLNTRGLFNIKDGEFQMIHTREDVTAIPLQKTVIGKEEPYYTLEALAIPNIHQFMKERSASDAGSRFVDGDNTVVLEITVDDNLYKITSKNLFDVITGKPNATTLTDNDIYVPLEAGKNYVFTFIIGKQRIEHLTAQVAEWETVTADPETPTNARIELDLEERGAAVSTDAKFYKAEDNKTTAGIDDDYAVYNWETGYTDLSATYSAGHWTTNYFWESSKDFYHFRALMPSSAAVVTDAENGDYVDLTSAASYTDVRWGAPMKDDGKNETPGSFKWKYGPDTNGFDADDDGNVSTGLPEGTTHQIYKAIGATKNPVKLVLFHMMSDLTIKIKTTTEADAVTLVSGGDKTVVELVQYKADGKVLLGNGLVQATSDPETVGIAHNSVDGNYQVYKFGAVPQDLENVELHITTPDHNLYKVSLASVKATAITTANIENPYSVTDGKYILDRWYPAFQYTYSFTLRKTGIKDLEATVVPWETVEADDEDIYIQ